MRKKRGLARGFTTSPIGVLNIATVSEAVADAFEHAKALQAEGSSVVPTDIAGVGFEPTTSGL
jgi:hypothetical protein